jgi:hypothetical protein
MRFLLLYGTALLAFAGLALSLTGCPNETTEPPADGGSDGPLGCKLAYVGDEKADIELEVVTLDPAYKAQPFAAGGDASILQPPQGGRVIFVGVRAKNLDPCAVKLAGAVRDPATMETRLDTRTINLDVGADGWAESDETDISTFSNVPVCSNTWASTDVFDQTFKLIVSVTDRAGKKATAQLDVVPRCDEKKIENGVDVQKDCLCICKQGYITGEPCNAAP